MNETIVLNQDDIDILAKALHTAKDTYETDLYYYSSHGFDELSSTAHDKLYIIYNAISMLNKRIKPE